MGIVDLFSKLKSKRGEKKVSSEETKYNSLSLDEQKVFVNKIMELSDAKLKKYIEKRPFDLAHIMDKVDERDYMGLIDIATKKGASVVDLVGKNPNISDKDIINAGVKNQPNIIYGNGMPKMYKDMITANTLITLFLSDPAVVLSGCKELGSSVEVRGVKKDGQEYVKHPTLKTQLLRAINLYMRPEIYKKNGFDDFAKSIADRVNGAEFVKALENMTSLLATAGNEVLTRTPEKAKSSSASTLHNWNNRVAHKLPKLAKSEVKRAKVLKESKLEVVRSKWYKLLCGLLSNPAINSFKEREKVSLVKDCITVIPEIYYDLPALNLKDIAEKSVIQYSAYKTFKSLKMHDEAKGLLEYLGEKESKKVVASTKAVAKRKANKKPAQVEVKDKETKEELLFDRNKY